MTTTDRSRPATPPHEAGAAGVDAAGTARLRADGVRLAYGDLVVTDGLDLEVLDGSVTAVVGPNGCGKSTLLRALGRLLKPVRGQVLLDGRRIDREPTREVARAVGVLPQTSTAPEGLTVADLVACGRHPHQTWYRQWSATDQQAVAQTLRWTGMWELAERPVDQLSGGQKQRAWLSMVLAQGTDLLLLHEPTTFLDLAYQVDVLDLVDRLHRDTERTVVVVLHDLNLAARYAHRLVAMKDGRVAAQGAPEQVLTEEVLGEVFDLDATVIEDPVAGTPLVVPVASRHQRER